jgi:hypothetical protein
MAELFSDEWSQAFKNAWNADEELTTSLQRAGFCSVVAFGYPDTDSPDFIMTIQDGVVTSLNKNNLDGVKWDIRATKDNWMSLIVKPPGLMKLGIAYTSRKLRFTKGDYATMIKDPSLAGAFVKSFALMGKVL